MVLLRDAGTPGGRDLVPLRSWPARVPVDRGTRPCRRAVLRAAVRRRGGPGRSGNLHLPRGSRIGARYFRSTIGHNCLELAGQDQSVSGGPFMWIKSAEASGGCDQRPRATGPRRSGARFTTDISGCHPAPDTSARSPSIVNIDGSSWQDAVESTGRHDCRLAFHVGPEVDCFLDGNLAQLSWQTGAGEWRAVMRLPQGARLVGGSRPDGAAAWLVLALLRGQTADRDPASARA